MCPITERAIVVLVTLEPREKGRRRTMTYYQGFDPHLIKERNETIRREVSAYRLEKRLRQNGEARPDGWLVALVWKGTLPLLRRARLAR
jgi:hypothetical protein